MEYGFRQYKKGRFVFYRSELIENAGGARHLFTTRLGGYSKGHLESLNLGFSRDDQRETVLKNYEVVLSEMQTDLKHLACTKQVHGTTVHVATLSDGGRGILQPHGFEADALITNERGLTLSGYGADCVVTLLYDPKQKACGVVHAGWRGTAGAILSLAVSAMNKNYGCEPGDLIAAIGPSIGKCCFECDGDVVSAMEAAFGKEAAPYLEKTGEKWHVDLPGINARQLLSAGLCEEHINLSGICTSCRSDLFWSHRKTKGLRGVQCAMISLI